MLDEAVRKRVEAATVQFPLCHFRQGVLLHGAYLVAPVEHLEGSEHPVPVMFPKTGQEAVVFASAGICAKDTATGLAVLGFPPASSGFLDIYKAACCAREPLGLPRLPISENFAVYFIGKDEKWMQGTARFDRGHIWVSHDGPHEPMPGTALVNEWGEVVAIVDYSGLYYRQLDRLPMSIYRAIEYFQIARRSAGEQVDQADFEALLRSNEMISMMQGVDQLNASIDDWIEKNSELVQRIQSYLTTPYGLRNAGPLDEFYIRAFGWSGVSAALERLRRKRLDEID